MAIILADLKAELIEDPDLIGYTRGRTRDDDVTDSNKLNSKETGRTRSTESVESHDLVAAARVEDLRGLSDRDFAIFDMVIKPPTINMSDSDIRGILDMFKDTPTEANIAELFNEPTSRSLELFGEDVSYSQVRQARELA